MARYIGLVRAKEREKLEKMWADRDARIKQLAERSSKEDAIQNAYAWLKFYQGNHPRESEALDTVIAKLERWFSAEIK